MPGLARVGDVCSKHEEGFDISFIVSGSADVSINGIAVARLGDAVSTHCTLPPYEPQCHDSYIAEGFPTILINGIPAAFVGGKTGCGAVILGSSHDTLAGE